MRLWLAIKTFFHVLFSSEKGPLCIETSSTKQANSDSGHLRLLALLQQSGRFIDFLKEDISKYTDAQVGAAVRKIHHDCGKCLEELVTIRPVMEENEGSTIKVVAGYNPKELKIVGKVNGEPPLTGTLVHRGWKVCKKSLPKNTGEHSSDVLTPAEIEVR